MSGGAGVAAEQGAVAHAVIVPFLGRLSMVARCVPALLACARPDTRILLVDDGSTPPAEADPAIRALLADPRVTLLRHAENRGVAAARNTALRWCREQGVAIVLMLDSDCEPSPDFIEAHLRLHAEHPDAACFGAAVEGTGRGIWAALDRVMTWVHVIGPAREVRHPYHLGTTNFSVKLDRLPNRATVFDERLNTGEDALLIRELRRGGESVRFAPAPLIVHHDRETLRGVLWHHYQYGQHQYFVQLGGDLAPRCFHPLYRAAFVLAFLPLLPLFALAGSVLNLAPWLRTHPGYVAWYPLMFALWVAKGVAVLESAVAPARTLRLSRPAAVPRPASTAAAVAPPAPAGEQALRRGLAALALLCVAAVYFSLSLPLGLELGDGGMILYPSWRVARGAVPYRDFTQLFGPSLFYANAAVLAVFGPDLYALRWVVLAVKLTTVGLVYLGARRVAGPAWALAAAAFATVLWGAPWWLFTTPYANHFALALCLAGLWLSLALPAPLVVRCAAAGLCFGLAATFKQTSGLFGLMALALSLLLAPADERLAGPPWFAGALGAALRWLTLAGSAAVVIAYLAPQQTAWTLLALAAPTAALLVLLARREWRGALDPATRAAGAAGILAAGAAAALPLLGYALFFAAHGALRDFVFNTARGLPERVHWFVPYFAPAWPAWVGVAGGVSLLVAARAWGRGAAWRGWAALAALAAIAVGWAVWADAALGGANAFGALALVLPLLAWAGVAELARAPRPPAAPARFAVFAVVSLLFLYPGGDLWHVAMIAPAFLPLAAHLGERGLGEVAPRRGAPLRLAVGGLALLLALPFLHGLVSALLAARGVAPARAGARGIVDPSPRFRAAAALGDYLAQRPGAPLLVTGNDSLFYVLAGRDSALAADEFVLYLVSFGVVADDTARELLPEPRVLERLAAAQPTIVEAPGSERFRRVYPQAAAWIDAHYRAAPAPAPYRVLEWSG